MMIAAWIARIMLCFCFGGPHFLHAQSFCRSLWHDTSFECKCASVQQSVSQWNALNSGFFCFFFVDNERGINSQEQRKRHEKRNFCPKKAEFWTKKQNEIVVYVKIVDRSTSDGTMVFFSVTDVIIASNTIFNATIGLHLRNACMPARHEDPLRMHIDVEETEEENHAFLKRVKYEWDKWWTTTPCNEETCNNNKNRKLICHIEEDLLALPLDVIAAGLSSASVWIRACVLAQCSMYTSIHRFSGMP